MKNQKSSSELKNFIKKIIAVDIALILISVITALLLNQYFGLVLFGLGILASILGSYLGNAPPYHPQNLEMSELSPYERPVEKTRTEALHFVKHTVSFYSFENAVLFAGVIAIVIGLLILFL
jgi:hypothetical protein